MLRFLKNFWPGLLWACVILVLTLLPGNYFPGINSFWELFSPDKLIHIFLFGVLSYLILQGAEKQYSADDKRYTIILPLLTAMLGGVITEVLQSVLPIGRDGNMFDTIADFAGCFTGLMIFRGLRKKKKKKLQTNAKNI
ncbi:MAG: VanZ family protein [Lentimicrobiaceae bacterium]|nr:VanZ family protein [Lentimicrobiaceae bacterium]MCB9024637.1 VanZ family protein [Lentimicrobiaceae bacterium]MCO5265170.1 VanZ family protein [Lentimicrobium sp.]